MLLIELQQWLSRFLLNYSHRVLGVAVSHLFSLVVHLLTIGILLLDLWLPLDCQHNLWLPQDVLTVRCSPITGVGNMLLVETGDELIGDGYHFPLHLDCLKECCWAYQILGVAPILHANFVGD